MKKLCKVLLSCLLFVLLLVGCADNGIRYDLTEVDFSSVTVDHYEYNYIEFDFESNTYELENKAKGNGIITRQKGSFFVDDEDYVTITNDDIPSQDYLLYEGETLYFKGDNFHAEAYIPGYGNVYMIFSKS
ncbi:MAG: hypothetical protein IJY11_03770 [Clostridia bacterium]|nr:hypothetical protein [Clostridia bacterium]